MKEMPLDSNELDHLDGVEPAGHEVTSDDVPDLEALVVDETIDPANMLHDDVAGVSESFAEPAVETLMHSPEESGASLVAVQRPAVPMDIEQLFRQHRHHLLRFVQRYVRKLEDAEDVVQSTFVEAMRCADRFTGLSKPSTWLFGIALNLARNHVRRSCAGLVELVDETFVNEIVDVNSDPAPLIELRELAKIVSLCLEEMPEKIRITFEAIIDGDATYEQVAEELQIPIGTVRSRVSRARAAVRTEVDRN